jgi:AcrR family transcriptional regulator
MRRERRLGDILEAGAAVLAERGPYGCTMRAVARSARTSLANLYRYVAGREDLLYRVQQRILEAAVASAQAAMAVTGARDRLRAVLTDHVRRILARPVEAEVLKGAPTPLRGERARRLEELRRRYLALVRAAAEAAVAGGRPPATARGKEADARTHLLLGMADRVAWEGARRRPTPAPDRLAAPVLGVFLAGTASRSRRPS